MPNNQHRMSTTIHSRPITPEYAKGWEQTFGRKKPSRSRLLSGNPDLGPNWGDGPSICEILTRPRSTNG